MEEKRDEHDETKCGKDIVTMVIDKFKSGEHDETNNGMESHSSAADIQSSGFEEENLGCSNVNASISNDKDDSDHHDTEAKFNPLFEKKNALHSGISSSNAIGTIAMTLPEADASGAPKRRLSTPSAIFSSEAGIQVRRKDKVCMPLSFVRSLILLCHATSLSIGRRRQ